MSNVKYSISRASIPDQVFQVRRKLAEISAFLDASSSSDPALKEFLESEKSVLLGVHVPSRIAGKKSHLPTKK